MKKKKHLQLKKENDQYLTNQNYCMTANIVLVIL